MLWWWLVALWVGSSLVVPFLWVLTILEDRKE
jgi:hypothetical protein